MLRDGVFSSELAITPLHSQCTVNDRNHSMTVFVCFFTIQSTIFIRQMHVIDSLNICFYIFLSISSSMFSL